MKSVKIKLKPMAAIEAQKNFQYKINPVRKPDLVGFRKILESKDPLRSISAFFKFEDIAVSKMRELLTFDDASNLLKLMADRHAPKSDDAHQILTIMKQLNIPITIDIYNSYLKILIKTNNFSRVKKTLEEIKGLGYELNQESYISFIQAFEGEKHFHEMLKFVQQMKEEGLEVNEEIYRHLLLVAFKDPSDLRNFENMLNIVQDSGYQNHPRLIDIIVRYAIEKDGLDAAQTMTMDLIKQKGYDEEVKSRIICTLLGGYLREKNYDKVLYYLDFMDKNGIPKFRKVYHLQMECLFYMKKAEEAFQVFEEMKKNGLEPDQFTYMVVITGYCEAGDLDRAVSFFNEYHDKELPRLSPIYRCLLQCYADRRSVSEANDLFNFMKNIDLYISMGIYEIMFELAYNTLDLSLMNKYWGLLTKTAPVEEQVTPSAKSYSLNVEVHLKCHHLDEANKKCKEMIAAGIEPDSNIFGSLLESNILARNFAGAAQAIQWMRTFSLNTSQLADKITTYVKERSSDFELIIHDLYEPTPAEEIAAKNFLESMEISSKRELIVNIYKELYIAKASISEKTYRTIMTLYGEQKDFVNLVKTWTNLIDSKLQPCSETINILLRNAKLYGGQRTVKALISFFQKETQFNLNEESYTLLLSMASSYAMVSDIRRIILDLVNHNFVLTPSMYEEMEQAFQKSHKSQKSFESIRIFIEEHFPEAIQVTSDPEVEEYEKIEKPEWFETQKKNC